MVRTEMALMATLTTSPAISGTFRIGAGDNGHSGQMSPESEPILVSVQPIRLNP